MKPEDQLRRLADPDRWNDESAWRSLRTPDDPATTPADRRADRRRLWVPAAAAAAIVAVAAGGVAIAVNAGPSHDSPPAVGSPSNDVVPWKALAAPTGSVTPAVDPTCDPASLTASSNPPDVAMGDYRLAITVTNHGPDCSLPNDQITLRSKESGDPEVTLATAVGDSPHLVRPIAEGATADFSVTFDHSCTNAEADNQDRTNPVLLGIADTDVPVTNTDLPDALTDCPKVYLIGPSEDDESTYPGLTATLAFPDTVTGSTLDYTVTLTNTGTKPITFKTCPTYKQGINAFAAGKKTETYQLNCAGSPTIDPGSSTEYAMRIGIPAGAHDLKLGWFLDHGPSSVGSLTHK